MNRAFTLFMAGYRYARGAELPKLTSEVITATMFELAYRELRERENVARLLEIMPHLVYAVLVPFMGPEGAGEFVEGAVKDGECRVVVNAAFLASAAQILSRR